MLANKPRDAGTDDRLCELGWDVLRFCERTPPAEVADAAWEFVGEGQSSAGAGAGRGGQ